MLSELEGTAVDDDRSVWKTHCLVVSFVRIAKKCPKIPSVVETRFPPRASLDNFFCLRAVASMS